jgi:hypothetical protein
MKNQDQLSASVPVVRSGDAVSSAVAASAVARLTIRQEYFGRFDYRAGTFDPPEMEESRYGSLTVDDQPIDWVWFADTDAGIAKTYDVFRDGKLRTVASVKPEELNLSVREIDCSGTVLSETLRGQVRIFGPAGSVTAAHTASRISATGTEPTPQPKV